MTDPERIIELTTQMAEQERVIAEQASLIAQQAEMIATHVQTIAQLEARMSALDNRRTLNGKWGASGRFTSWAINLAVAGDVVQGIAMQITILSDVMYYTLSGTVEDDTMHIALVYTRNPNIRAEMSLDIAHNNLAGQIIEGDKIPRAIEFYGIK